MTYDTTSNIYLLTTCIDSAIWNKFVGAVSLQLQVQVVVLFAALGNLSVASTRYLVGCRNSATEQ